MKVPILSDLKSKGESTEYLFWVGCAGSFDDRSKKVTKAFVKILNKAKIGKNSIIGANALVTENKVIPERSLVLGSPGKIIRQVTDEEIKSIKENAEHYVANYKKYKK